MADLTCLIDSGICGGKEGQQMPELIVQIVRWVDDDPQPGIVACEFEDAEGYLHTVIEKQAVASEVCLDASSAYPRPGIIRCEVLTQWRDSKGRELARITTERPYSIETTEGLSEFVVLASQLA